MTLNKVRTTSSTWHTHFWGNIIGKKQLDKHNDEVNGQVNKGGDLGHEITVVDHRVLH